MCIYTYIHTRDAAAHTLSTGWTLLCELTQPHSGESNVVKTRGKPQIHVFYHSFSDEHINHI